MVVFLLACVCGVEDIHLISRHYLRKESPERLGLLLFILSPAFEMHSQAQVRQPRIPEQQSVGQTLPPVPVGMDTSNAPPLPPGAMPSGSRVQVQKYQVIIHNFLAEGIYTAMQAYMQKDSLLTEMKRP